MKAALLFQIIWLTVVLAIPTQAQLVPVNKPAATPTPAPKNVQTPAPTVVEAHAHEYGELREFVLPIKDFTFNNLADASFNLRAAGQGRKLVLVHFFAAWCHSSNYDVVTINELYRKYKDAGFTVIGVCEYSKPDELREFIKKHQPEYPIVIESKRTKDRTNTQHYAYRQAMEDKRVWGTPLNIFLPATDFRADSEFITSHTYIVLGELMKPEVEKFIRQQLQLQ
jgi:peroxiredoxin